MKRAGAEMKWGREAGVVKRDIYTRKGERGVNWGLKGSGLIHSSLMGEMNDT